MSITVNYPIPASGEVTYPKLRVILDSLSFVIDAGTFYTDNSIIKANIGTAAAPGIAFYDSTFTTGFYAYTTGGHHIFGATVEGHETVEFSYTGGTFLGTWQVVPEPSTVTPPKLSVLTPTSLKGKISITPVNNAGDYEITILNASHAAARNYTLADAGADASFVMTQGTQTITGATTFSSAVAITPVSNQLVLGATRTVTLTAPTPATSSRTITLPDLVGDYSVVGTIGAQTIAGAKTFSSAIAITATSNHLVLSTATNAVTINANTSASARTWSIPDISAAGTFAALEGTQTFSGAKTFSADLTNTSGTGTSFLAQATVNGGVVGLFADNASNTAGSDARLALRVAGTSANDPYINFNISGSTQWAIGTDNTDSDNWKLSQSSTLGTNDTLVATTGGDIYTVPYTDYSGTSTIVGWSSFTIKVLQYKKIGKLVFVMVTLNGTSNSTSTTFTLPFTSSNDTTIRPICYVVDNGVSSAGRASLPPNSATVTCGIDTGGTGFTASGTKTVIVEFFYQAA